MSRWRPLFAKILALTLVLGRSHSATIFSVVCLGDRVDPDRRAYDRDVSGGRALPFGLPCHDGHAGQRPQAYDRGGRDVDRAFPAA